MLTLFWQAARPKTLAISFSSISLGNGLAYIHGQANGAVFLLSLMTALLLQVSVNLANDYFDAVNGIDGPDRLGPARLTQQGLLNAGDMRIAIALSLVAAVLVGLCLLAMSPFSSGFFYAAGIASVIAALAYSAGPLPLAANALGELAVFIFFGLLAIQGSYYLQVGQVTLAVYLAACQLGFVIAAVMLLNNIRDRETDIAAGKRTLAALLGDKRSRKLYCILLLLPGLLQAVVSGSSNLGLVVSAVMVAVATWYCRQAFVRQGTQLNDLLSATAACSIFFTACILLVEVS